MKKAFALTLTVAFFLSVFLLIPSSSLADADGCYDDWERCRERALGSDAGWFRTAIMLTVCDVALGKCLLTMK